MIRVHNFYFIVSLVLFAGIAIASNAGRVERQNSVNRSASDTSYWQIQTTGFVGDTLNALSTVDKNVCWLAGTSGTIIRTIDEGNTWSLINPGIIDTQRIHVIEGVSDSIAFASTTPSDTTYIYRTTNGGFSWTKVFSQHGGFIDGIKMFSQIKGIVVGDPVGGRWTILKTTNGGETWFRISMEPLQIGDASGGTRLGTFDTSYVWFFDNKGRQYFSADGGETWGYSTDTSTGAISAWFMWQNKWNLWLMVSSTQVVCYHLGYILKGLPPGFLNNPTGLVGALGTSEFWLLQGAIYFTPDAGTTWTANPPNGLNKPTTLIDMVTLGAEVSAWATGIGDTVYHYHRTLTGVDEDPQSIPQEFSLSQNYPNPFNPSTKIGFKIQLSGFTTLKVYDVLGKEVKILVNEKLESGSYETMFDAAGLASGVYFYRLSVVPTDGRDGQAGHFVKTRKLVLLR